MESTNVRNLEVAARHIRGATIAWGCGKVYDFTNPNPEVITIEDAAYALAYTVRWRGQARTLRWARLRRFFRIPLGRAFFGVGQHCVFGAEEMIAEGHDREDALAFLFHENDEIVLPDMPGPAKPELPGWKPFAKRQGDAALARFGITIRNPDLVKKIDLRMMVTEKRDLMHGHEGDWFQTSGHDQVSDIEYAPFARRIIPYRHPDQAVRRFLELYRELTR